MLYVHLFWYFPRTQVMEDYFLWKISLAKKELAPVNQKEKWQSRATNSAYNVSFWLAFF